MTLTLTKASSASYETHVITLAISDHLMATACEWLGECFPTFDYGDSAEDWARLSPDSIAARIERHYSGGLAEFIHNA